MDDEAIAVAVDIGSRVRLELDGDICGGGVELEAGLWSSILTQHFGCKVIAVIEGQQVIFPNVQPETGIIHRIKSTNLHI